MSTSQIHRANKNPEANNQYHPKPECILSKSMRTTNEDCFPFDFTTMFEAYINDGDLLMPDVCFD